MAKITPIVALTFLGLALGSRIQAQTREFPPEVADAKAVAAFKNYWNAYEAYEDSILKDGEKKFQQAWDGVKKAYQRDRQKISQDQLDSLQKSAANYRKHLEQHPNAENRPYVMLNLAQILSLIGDNLSSADPNSGTFAKNEALGLLKDLETSYQTFGDREQALYLRASLLESMDRDDDALTAWQTLAATAQSTIYGVHARVAVGDHMFKRERPADAMRSYQRALELLPDAHAEDSDYERLRIDYRLAWSAYRATDLNVAVKAAGELLVPGSRIKSSEQRQKIQLDAVDLMGNALYENNVMGKTKEVLRRKELVAFAGAIGLVTIKHYNSNGIHSEAGELGEFLVDEHPLAAETPEILQITSDSWVKLGKPQKRLEDLEKLALLLPAQSLWRARHNANSPVIQRMESLAVPAAAVAATTHYDMGLASGNPKAFAAASGFYDILLDHAPNNGKSNEWRLRHAHCEYFAGNYTEAAKQYEALKTEFKVDNETLQVAAYQLVLTNEKRWRDEFNKAAEKGNDPFKDTATILTLTALEKSIDEFASRFPTQGRSIDVLLVGASANRDMDRLDASGKYWQRALVSQPSPAQRGIAVRGLVYGAMRTGSSADVVELSRRFLKLEDWNALGLNIGNELRGVLSAAALDEGKRLSGSGRALEAGLLLTQIAGEFPDLPDRDRIFRDGAYMLAIAGDWSQAQKASEDYFASGLVRNRADMTYLLARAHEYQIRLHDAALKYLELGEKYPKHGRAGTSLARAEKLALAEGDFDLASRAAVAQAERSATETERLAAFTHAAEYMDKEGDASKALNIARRRQRISKSPTERLKSQLLAARMTYKSGSEQEGLDDLVILTKEIDRQRLKLTSNDYAALAGETHFLLGEEARKKFEDFRIAERGGAVGANITQKSHYFEDLAAEYDRAAAAGDPKWSSQARYQLASSAEALADEIASLPNLKDEATTFKSQNRYQATAQRLQAMARKYYSTNALAARRDPAKYHDNEWVKKSALRLNGETSENPENHHHELMPASYQNTTPSQWSL